MFLCTLKCGVDDGPNRWHRQKNLLYASTRIRARVVGDDGAVAGLFYYRDGNNESDIEILTRDETSAIRYSNQPVVDEG
jgi:hypothetical protein